MDKNGNGCFAADDRSDGSAGAVIDLGRAPCGIHVGSGLGPAVGEFEFRIAERLREGIPHRPWPGHLTQFYDVACYGRSRLPFPEQCQADAEREGSERGRLVTPEALVERIVTEDPVCQRVLEVPRDECQVRDRRHEDGEHGGRGVRRADEAPQQQNAQGCQPADPGAQPVAVEGVEEPVITSDQNEVWRTLKAARRLRIEDCRRQQTEKENRPRIREGHDCDLEARPQLAGRVRQPRVSHERSAGDETDDAHGETERYTDSGVAQLRQEPCEAGRVEQDAEPIGPMARAKEETCRDERPPSGELGNPPERRRASERADRMLSRDDEGQDPQTCREQCKRDPAIPREGHAPIVAYS